MPRSRLSLGTSKSASSGLKEQTAKACLVAKDAVANLTEFMEDSSRMAFLTIRDCERELDRLEQEIDESLPAAITRVGERKARELLACLRFITDLERIGDLAWWVAQRIHDRVPKLSATESDSLRKMGLILVSMLEDVHRGFISTEYTDAQSVITRDREIDQLRRDIFTSRLKPKASQRTPESVEVLFITQALERAGDHATNLAEELIHLHQGRSVRHLPKRVIEN